MNRFITKAVIPAAGLGTRMFPATVSVAKEMLPYGSRPIIEYIVRDAVESGIEQILIVINKGKEGIISHFKPNEFQENELLRKNKLNELALVRELQNLCQIEFVYQDQLAGLGDAIAMARNFTGKDAFAVLLGDNVLISHTKRTILSTMIDVFNQYQKSVVAVQSINPKEVYRYGIMFGTHLGKRVYQVIGWVEKPEICEAPSNIAVAGQYIFTPEIYDALEKTEAGINGELQITDAMDLIARESTCYSYLIDGERKDLGNYKSYLQANIEYGLKDPKYGSDLKDWLRKKLKEDNLH